MCCNMLRLPWDKNGQVSSLPLAGPHLCMVNTFININIMHVIDSTWQKFDV